MSKQQKSTRQQAGVASDTLSTVGLVIALGTFFASVPLATHDDDVGTAWWLIALAIGSSLLLTGVVVRMFRRSGNLFRLLALLLIVAVVCALGIYTVATELPGQFSGIETRIDALYFTLTTMTTTGYGDIHAVGQLARVIVSCIFFFDLLFVGLVGVELSRIAQRQHEGSESQPADQEAPSATPESPEPHVSSESSESLAARDTFAASDSTAKKSDPADTHAEAPVPTSEITPEPVSGQPTVQTKPDGTAE